MASSDSHIPSAAPNIQDRGSEKGAPGKELDPMRQQASELLLSPPGDLQARFGPQKSLPAELFLFSSASVPDKKPAGNLLALAGDAQRNGDSAKNGANVSSVRPYTIDLPAKAVTPDYYTRYTDKTGRIRARDFAGLPATEATITPGKKVVDGNVVREETHFQLSLYNDATVIETNPDKPYGSKKEEIRFSENPAFTVITEGDNKGNLSKITIIPEKDVPNRDKPGTTEPSVAAYAPEWKGIGVFGKDVYPDPPFVNKPIPITKMEFDNSKGDGRCRINATIEHPFDSKQNQRPERLKPSSEFDTLAKWVTDARNLAPKTGVLAEAETKSRSNID